KMLEIMWGPFYFPHYLPHNVVHHTALSRDGTGNAVDLPVTPFKGQQRIKFIPCPSKAARGIS
ncbi:hypothetical protein O3P69_011137, partial [Scylla paramamosain]